VAKIVAPAALVVRESALPPLATCSRVSSCPSSGRTSDSRVVVGMTVFPVIWNFRTKTFGLLGALWAGRRDAPAVRYPPAGVASCPAHRVVAAARSSDRGAGPGGTWAPAGIADCQACQQARETDRPRGPGDPHPLAPLHFPRDALCSFPPPGDSILGPRFVRPDSPETESIAAKAVGVDPPQLPRCQECLRGRRGGAPRSLASSTTKRPGHRSASGQRARFHGAGTRSPATPNARANCSVAGCSWSTACRNWIWALRIGSGFLPARTTPVRYRGEKHGCPRRRPHRNPSVAEISARTNG